MEIKINIFYCLPPSGLLFFENYISRMGDIVNRWITEKLGLKVPPANNPPAFRVEIANGILIAEILRKYGILSDDEFVSLRHSNTKKNRYINMAHLHKWLTNAGMNIQHILLVDVAEEKSGSAVKLLYELFLWLEHGPRTSKVSSKAMSYLTTLKHTPEEEISSFLESGRSISSTKLDTSQKLNKDWEKSPIQTPITKTKKSILIKKSNWRTTLDKSFAPQLLVNMGPFSELSEAAQAQALYFTRESLDILDRQRLLFNRVETLHQEPNIHMHHHHLHTPPSHELKAKICSELKSQSNYHLKIKSEEYKNSIDEIRKFDRKLKANKNKTKNNGVIEKTKNEYTKVYSNGKGSEEQLKISLEVLKNKRQKYTKINENLGKCRKATAHRMLEMIPINIENDLKNTVIKSISRLPYSERLFADFIYNSHLEKTCFKQHACFEARQKQIANDFDLAKELQIVKQQDQLKRSVLEHRTRQPSKLVEDDGDDELEEIIYLDKITMIDELLNNLVDIVVTVGDYRSAMGNASFGTDIFRDAIESGAGIQACVSLKNDKFVLEYEQNFHSDILSTLPAPPAKLSTPTKHECEFLVHHVAILLDRFLQIANGSLIPMKAFTFIIEDLILTSKRNGQGELNESLPEAWLHLSTIELKKIVYLLMGKRGFINWRNFLIACLNIRFPNQNEIILILKEFRYLDPASLFLIDKIKFDTISLWFEPNPPCVLSEAFKALHMRECIFFMFADRNGYFYYIDFLLYFCKDICPAMGIAKGLAVLTGHPFSTKGFEERYNAGGAVLLTDIDLELMFEKTKPLEGKPGSLVPPNTPLPKYRSDQKKAAKNKEMLQNANKDDVVISENDNGGVDGKHKKHKRRKSKVQRKSLGSVKDRKDVTFIDPNENMNQTQNNTQQLLPTEKNKSSYGLDKQLGVRIPFQNDNNTETTLTLPRQLRQKSEHSNNVDVSNVINVEISVEDTIPAEAFLQAMWFGHITSYPVEDPSFVSSEYLKMKKFIDAVYTELYDNQLANLNDEIYTAQLNNLLQHPFINEIIKRFITYKFMDLSYILKEVIPTSTSDLDLDNMESPPSTGSREEIFGKDFLSDIDSAGELDGTTLISNSIIPNQNPSVSDGHSLELTSQNESVRVGSITLPVVSMSAPNALSASLDARTPRTVRRTRSINPAPTSSISSKSK